MRFWGAEVQAEKPLIVNPGEDYSIHISQATLDLKGKHFKGKGKDLKGKEKDLKGKDLKEKEGGTADLFVEVDGQKLMIGSLSQDKFPHVCFDLVFEKEFELSHSLTEGSVHFVGYRSPNIDEKERDDFSGSQAVPAANGNAASNVVKVDSKQKAKPADEEDSDGEDDGSDSEKRMDVDEDDEDDSEEDKETPKQPEPSNKKRANESASNTRVSSKKAKLAVTPQKTEEKKKGGHTATPHPAKKGGKSPGIANQSPKFGGQSSGGSNKNQFNSGNSSKKSGSNKKSNKGKGKGKGA